MSTTDTFTSTGTWTCPAFVTTVWARCWGGGGSGGGVNVTPSTTSAAGGGGAGGSFSEKIAYPVTPGNVYTVTVAATRTGSTGNGAAGNDSWFDNNTTGVLAKGGAPGLAPPNGFGSTGFGGTGSTTGCIGDNVYAGGSGALALADSTTFIGGGGGGAGSGAAGSAAGSPSSSGGGGGATLGGAGANPRNTAGNGGNGSTYGGGGAGAFGTVASHSFSGGSGAAGRIELEYTPTFVPASGGIRAVVKEFVDVNNAPAVLDGVAPTTGDVFLLLQEGSSVLIGIQGLWSWASIGSAMTNVLDTDGTYRYVRQGTSAGMILFTTVLPPGVPGYYINPTVSSTQVVIQEGTPTGFVGVSPAVTSGGTWTVQHNLGTKFLLVQIAATATPFAYVTSWAIQRTDLNTLSVIVGATIAAGDYEIMVRAIL